MIGVRIAIPGVAGKAKSLSITLTFFTGVWSTVWPRVKGNVETFWELEVCYSFFKKRRRNTGTLKDMELFPDEGISTGLSGSRYKIGRTLLD